MYGDPKAKSAPDLKKLTDEELVFQICYQDNRVGWHNSMRCAEAYDRRISTSTLVGSTLFMIDPNLKKRAVSFAKKMFEAEINDNEFADPIVDMPNGMPSKSSIPA